MNAVDMMQNLFLRSGAGWVLWALGALSVAVAFVAVERWLYYRAVAGAASQVASQAVMSSIAEALVATAVGILVALPAIALYNYLQRRVAELLAGSEVLSNLVLAYLVERRAEPTPPAKEAA